MKTWRVVTTLSFTFSFLAAAFIFTTPLRYPGFTFLWRSIVIFLIHLVVILGLLVLRQLWSHRLFSRALFAMGLLLTALTALSYMGLPILAVSVLALFGMFVSSRSLDDTRGQ